MTEFQTDNSGNQYIDVKNIRLTFKKNSKLSIRSYVNSKTNKVNIGPEIKIDSAETILDLINALCLIYKNQSKK